MNDLDKAITQLQEAVKAEHKALDLWSAGYGNPGSDIRQRTLDDSTEKRYAAEQLMLQTAIEWVI